MEDSSAQGAPTAPIDWPDIHRRLEELRMAVERGWSPAPDEKQKILEARAQMLAQQPDASEGAEGRLEMMEFCLGYERYGVESAFVREVVRLTHLTHLPCTPPFVLGIINVRGEIISVVDLKWFFGLPAKEPTDLNKVIILHSESMMFGIVADLVVGVRPVSIHELQSSLPTLTGIPEEYLKGVTQDRTVILDAAKLLSDSKIIVHEDVPI
jgi:purine-binding chemotaxis protein CheW